MAFDDRSDSMGDDDPIPEVDEAAIRKLDEEIIAAEDNEVAFFLVCPNCGGRDLGVVPSEVDAAASTLTPWENRHFCHTCNFEGVALLFDDEEIYQKFRESRGGIIHGTVGT
jgi:hypothetical protein